jgi:predicted HicB family RNase H-like nuclease
MSASKGERRKFTLRMPGLLARKVKLEAQAESLSVNDYIIQRLEEAERAS